MGDRIHKNRNKQKNISSQNAHAKDNVFKFTKKGLTPSQSGFILPDTHGIAQLNDVTRSKTIKGPIFCKKNMVCRFRFKYMFFKKGCISKKKKTVKRHGITCETPNDVYEPMSKKRIMEGQGPSSEIPKPSQESIFRERILKAYGLGSEVPMDVYWFLQNVVVCRKELDEDINNRNAKGNLEMAEGKLEVIVAYNKDAKKLPPDWTYDPTIASTL